MLLFVYHHVGQPHAMDEAGEEDIQMFISAIIVLNNINILTRMYQISLLLIRFTYTVLNGHKTLYLDVV